MTEPEDQQAILERALDQPQHVYGEDGFAIPLDELQRRYDAGELDKLRSGAVRAVRHAT